MNPMYHSLHLFLLKFRSNQTHLLNPMHPLFLMSQKFLMYHRLDLKHHLNQKFPMYQKKPSYPKNQKYHLYLHLLHCHHLFLKNHPFPLFLKNLMFRLH
jgi:hypothetical protein